MDGIATPPDPRPFGASLDVLGSVLPGTNWLTLRRLAAGRKSWIANLSALAAITMAMVILFRVTSAFSPRPSRGSRCF